MAVETNKTKWTDSFAKSIGVTTNPTGGEGGGDNPQTDKYDALEYTSYKDMLSSKIQASVARDQAQKYVGASLNNAGFGGQGMAESTKAGIMGTYNKAIMGADEQHQANLIDIENQRQVDAETANSDKWQSAMTMLNQASSQEDLDYVKNNFYADMTPEQQKYFDYYYNSFSKGFVGSDVNTAGEYSYADNKAYAYDENGGSIQTSGKFNKENETLNSAIATGKIEKGTYIQLHNLSNQDCYLYYGTDGKLYYVSKDTYNGATNKVHIYGKESGVNAGAYNG